MRKIEQSMVQAVAEGRDWCSGNTEVAHFPVIGRTQVFLHGNRIADVTDNGVAVNHDTLRRWPTRTTCSRLRALGVDVKVVGGKAYIDGRAV